VPRTATTDASSKDPLKLSKAELIRLYASTTAAKEDLVKKYGQYSRVSRAEVHQMSAVRLITYPVLLGLGRLRKKHKRTKSTLDASQGSAASRNEETIPYPTGQTPGRGDFQLAQFLKVSQEEHNAFTVCILLSLEFIC
jgi:hypothetical protein